jgi:hypothetical protein
MMAPARRAMALAYPSVDPLSTTMTSVAWARAEARLWANHEPGRWETTMTEEDGATSA